MSETGEMTSAAVSGAVGGQRFREGATMTVVDEKGRTLKIKQLSLLEEMKLLSAAGPVNSEIRKWMTYATLAACVRDVDGLPLPFPTSDRTIPALMERVGAEGVAAVTNVLRAEMDQAELDGIDMSTSGVRAAIEGSAGN